MADNLDELKSTRAAVLTRYALLSVKKVNPECSLAIRSSEFDEIQSLREQLDLINRSHKPANQPGVHILGTSILER